MKSGKTVTFDRAGVLPVSYLISHQAVIHCSSCLGSSPVQVSWERGKSSDDQPEFARRLVGEFDVNWKKFL